MIQWGLISKLDSETLMKTIDLICNQFPEETIKTIEIGLFNGQTSLAIYKYIQSKGRRNTHTGIDNEKDKPVERPFLGCNLIIGNSNEVYNQLEDNSQHLIFVDGCHCFAHVVSDFFCYAPKVKTGGYFAFHDTGKHIQPMKDFQHGDKNNPDAYISVRKALDKVGVPNTLLTKEYGGAKSKICDAYWELVFDEADPENEAGGICVFKKLY